MRRGVIGVALLLGVVMGYTATVMVGAPAPIEASDTPRPRPLTPRPAASAPVTTLVSPTSPVTSSPEPVVYLIWSSGGVPPELVADLVATFPEVTVVGGDMVELAAAAGWVIPLDALSFDPATMAEFPAAEAADLLVPGTVILSETSAELRGAGEGDELEIGGDIFEVGAVVADSWVASAEVVFHADDPALPVEIQRYVLVRTDRDRSSLEREVRALYDGPAPLRIRTEAETPWLRHGDAVLPQALVKEALGEFAIRNISDSRFEQEPAFRRRWIVTADLPLLGEVTCHEKVVEMLTGAMDELAADGLDHLIDPAGYRGCWNPRLVRTVTGASSGLSRHSWGAAVDINASANPLGSAGSQDERLVEVMEKWGFTWGGDWLVPDPMHFEYGVPPD